MLIPDSKLETATDLQDRLQSIFRQYSVECDKGARDRRGNSTPALQDKHTAKLKKLDDRATTIKARLRAMGAPLYR